MDVKVGLLGLGHVGGGVFRLLQERAAAIGRNCGGLVPRITRVLVRDRDKPRQLEVDQSLLTTDPEEILSDGNVNVVIELMGGTEPAHAYVKQALANGKHVVLANKELMARHGPSLLAYAESKGLQLLFEASVAGGIPIIRALRESLSGDRIVSLQGIINGTTNYILTRMMRDGLPFHHALEEAQRRGYAEADPRYDIHGVDAAYKLVILAAIASQSKVKVSDVPYEGIDRVHLVDIEYARDLGYTIKLLAQWQEDDSTRYVGVQPCMVPHAHPLASVQDNFNAILVRGEWCGDLMFFGQGAGGRPTATAVVSDLIKVTDHLARPRAPRSRKPSPRSVEKKPLRHLAELPARHYMRLRLLDQPGVLASVALLFAREDVSFLSVLQKSHGESVVDVVFLTHEAAGKKIQKALDKVRLLPSCREVAATYRVV